MPAAGWNSQQFERSANENSNMRIRFGFDVAQADVYPAPGWNVDDVLVAAVGCPAGP